MWSVYSIFISQRYGVSIGHIIMIYMMINHWNKALEFGVDNFQTDPYEFGYLFITTVIYCIYWRLSSSWLSPSRNTGIILILIILSLLILHLDWKERQILGNHQLPVGSLTKAMSKRQLAEHCGYLQNPGSPPAATGHDLRPTEVPQLKDEVMGGDKWDDYPLVN